MSRAGSVALACWLAGCGGGAGTLDAGAVDAGDVDAASGDAAGADGSIVPDLATPDVVPTVGDFYVALDGDDAFSGTLSARNAGGDDGPFRTIGRARDAMRAFDKTGRTQVVTLVRGGTYYLDAPIMFGATDSGSDGVEIVYQAFAGEHPIFSGGIRVSGWVQASPGRWTVSLDPAKVAPFEQLFFAGERRYRPRTTPTGYLRVVAPVVLSSAQPNCPLASPGKYLCFDRFQYAPGDLSPSWTTSPITDIELDVFEKWTMAKLRLKSIDDVNHIAYLTGPTFENVDNNGFIAQHRYLVENVKDALSQPGDWFLDRGTSPWTLTYLSKPGEDPNASEVIVPQQAQLLVATDLGHVTFRGLGFSHDDWVVPDAGHVSWQAEVYVGAAVSFVRPSHVHIDACELSHLGAWALELVGTGPVTTTPANRVTGNRLYDLGVGGLRVGGTDRTQGDDDDGNVTQQVLVEDNVVAGGGRILPAGIGTGIWVGHAHHVTISHNDVYDFYGGGIGVSEPSLSKIYMPHDIVTEYNHIYDQGQGVTSDFGGIYYAVLESSGNVIRNNKIHDVTHDPGPDGYGGNGIYLDNITSYVTVQDNLVYRTSQANVFNNRGHDNVLTNNILARGHSSLVNRGTPTMPGDPPIAYFSFTATKNIFYLAQGSVQRTPGRWTCIGGCAANYAFDDNQYFDTRGAPTFYSDDASNHESAYTLAQWRSLFGEDLHSQVGDPLFTDPSYPADDFTLSPTSPALAVGFVPFDASKAGRITIAAPPPSVPPAFPLQLLDPASDF